MPCQTSTPNRGDQQQIRRDQSINGLDRIRQMFHSVSGGTVTSVESGIGSLSSSQQDNTQESTQLAGPLAMNSRNPLLVDPLPRTTSDLSCDRFRDGSRFRRYLNYRQQRTVPAMGTRVQGSRGNIFQRATPLVTLTNATPPRRVTSPLIELDEEERSFRTNVSQGHLHPNGRWNSNRMGQSPRGMQRSISAPLANPNARGAHYNNNVGQPTNPGAPSVVNLQRRNSDSTASNRSLGSSSSSMSGTQFVQIYGVVARPISHPPNAHYSVCHL